MMSVLPDLRRVAGPQPEFCPVANPAAVVRGPGVRFTVLTPRLLRLEYDPDEAFEDRPSQAFWYRQQPVPPFDVQRSEGRIEVDTGALHLVYRPGPRGLTRDALSVQLLESGVTWRPGDRDGQNLGGTARTLDEADGAVRLEPGLVSRAGWSVVDDSETLVFDDQGWLVPRGPAAKADLYFFGYGSDYLGCLRDYFRVAGPAPLVPRWLLGNWWSRYWAYDQESLQAVVHAFRDHEVPLSVVVVDMDWHVTDSETSSGWTGYTWNQELFPEPEALLAWLHGQGLRVTLNLHPAEGVHPHEAQYEAMTSRLGIDPSSGQPVAFDITDPAFVQAYFELLHHPLEEQGVDFWWIDWQQGQRTRLSGLDPLWWLNHLHFYDAARPGRGRPIIFSRWGGLGNHRYPIGFSGDTVVSWDSLAFQPYFTATAANVGYGWWSHDIGGHMDGVEDPELYLRWVQFGALSPVLRLHSTNNPYHERHPWGYDATVLQLAREAMQFRHAFIPYLYPLAWHALQQGRTLVLPAYHLHPGEEPAYHCPAQYYLGPDLIAAPFTLPREGDTRLSRQVVWLPEVPGEDGRWYAVLDGVHLRAGAPYRGGGWHTLYGALEDVPLFARS
ncbi:MAG: TIM-barrel domain-containing protein, partial [Anaerolineae bacterium]